jgi:hypothetical protein
VEGLWKKYWWKPNQAHNGYYETYLNLGYIGVLLQLGMILGGYLTAKRTMQVAMESSSADRDRDFAMARFGTGYLLALAAYNFTEATFKALHLSFFVFFVVAIQYRMERESVAAVVRPIRQKETKIQPKWAAVMPTSAATRVSLDAAANDPATLTRMTPNLNSFFHPER